jgi:hypothetical protein
MHGATTKKKAIDLFVQQQMYLKEKKTVVNADPEGTLVLHVHHMKYIFKIYPDTEVSCLFSLELSTATKRQ